MLATVRSSGACFAALLGDPSNGRWKIAPSEPEVKRRWGYLPNSLILETRYETATGVACVIDFMPPRAANSTWFAWSPA